MTKRGATYARISKDREGGGLGVDRQEADCRALAEQVGATIVEVYRDNDLSAYSGKPRPGYQRLLADIEAGHIDVVLVWHTDRLHRSPAELETWINTCHPRGVAVHTVKAGPLDLATPSGRMVARQLGAVARYEVEHLIERQQSAKQQAAAAGEYRGGSRPYGYEADGVTVRPDEAHVVADMTRRVLMGESLHSIATELNKEGLTTSLGKPWRAQGIRRTVMRPRNAAFIGNDERPEMAEAKWPAIVERDTWRAARAFLADPTRQPARTTSERFLGSGVYRCGECGDVMISKRTRGAGKVNHPSYKCGSSYHVTRIAAPIDELVSEVVIERLSRPDARLLLAPPDGEPLDVAGLQDEAATRQAQLDEVSDLFSDMKITGEQFARTTETIRARLDEIHEALSSTVAGTPLEGFADAADVRAAWEAAAIGRKKAVVNALMTVTILKSTRGRKPGGGYFDPDLVKIEPKQ